MLAFERVCACELLFLCVIDCVAKNKSFFLPFRPLLYTAPPPPAAHQRPEVAQDRAVVLAHRVQNGFGRGQQALRDGRTATSPPTSTG